MPKVLPSEIVSAIDQMFGPNRNELDMLAVKHHLRAEVQALLTLLDQVPSELIDLGASDYLELARCRGVLSTCLPGWSMGDIAPARQVNGKDTVACIRRLMTKCHDEMPLDEPELPFVLDMDVRLGIEDRIHAAWLDFKAREWMGATVFAAAALEALLLWALKNLEDWKEPRPKRAIDEQHLSDLIRLAVENRLLDQASSSQASLAKDARNLIHPGKALRSGESCNKATALTALAAVYRVADELKRASGK